MNLTQLSISRPKLIVVLFLVLGILGAFSYTQLRYELLPNIATPFVTVVTTFPGASPTEVETGLTKPIEEAVSTVDQIKRITAQSFENVSTVQIEFRQDADADRAVQDVQRRVNEWVANLPAGAKAPTVSKFSLADMPVLRVAATSKLPELAFGQLLKNVVKPRLAQVPGVGRVELIGLTDTEVNVALDADRLRALNLAVPNVVAALQNANLNVPAGRINDADGSFSVRIAGKTDVLARLRDVVISANAATGANVRLGEVATLFIGKKEMENLNRFNGQNAVGLLISKQSGGNNVALSAAVRAVLAQLEAEQRSVGLNFQVAQDGAEFTLAAARAVNVDLGLAIGLVALVMFVFLHSIRSSLIVLVAIPASLLSTFGCMLLFGFSLNLLTLLALSLVIGILVDDSIVVLESIYQRMERGEKRGEAALNGRNDIGFAAVAITLVDVVVFVPLSLAPGLVGDLLREFSLVVVVSTLFSLLVSFTLTPMLASRFGKVEHLSKKTLFGRFGLWFERGFAWLNGTYRTILQSALTYRKTTVAVVLALLVASLLLPATGFIGSEFVAPTDKGEISVTLQFRPGQKLDQTDILAQRFEQQLRQMPEVRRVFTNVGANPDGFVPTPNAVEFAVSFVPKSERSKNLTALMREVKERAALLPGARAKVFPLGILGNEGGPPILLLLSGPNRDVVRSEAARLTDALRSVPGLTDLRSSGNTRRPEVDVVMNRPKLAQLGLTTEGVGMAVRTALAGFDDLKIQQQDVATTLRVRLAEPFRQRTDQLARLTLQTPAGTLVELREVADIRESFAPSLLERTDRSPAVTISAQATGRPVGDIGEDIRQRVETLRLDPSVRLVYGGDLELQGDAFGKLGLVFGAAVLFMYLIMVALYNSWTYPFVVLFSIPVAIVGALLGLALTQNSLNVFTILGLIMMLGLVAKNAILLVEKANQNRAGGLPLLDALLDAGQTRLRPILMTTLAMVIGMLPIALAHGPGAELKTGLAWALIGGLSSSMFLTLVFVPVVYYYVGRSAERRARRAGKRSVLKKAVAVACLVLVANVAVGQSLSLQQATDLVRQQNGDVRVAQLDTERAALRSEEARRGRWPTLNGQAQYQRNLKPPVFFFPAISVNPNTGDFLFDDSRLTAIPGALPNAYTATADLRLPLIQPDLPLLQQQAAAGQRVATEQQRVTVARQVAEVKKTYLTALLLDAQRQLTLRSLDRAGRVLTDVRARYRQQMALDADTLRAFVDVENLRPALLKLDRQARQLRRQLAVLTGLDPDAPLTLTDSLTVQDVALGTALSDAASGEQRPELRQLAGQLDVNRLQSGIERARQRPSLHLFGQASTLTQMNTFDFRGSNWPFIAFVGLQLNIPLFNATTAPKLQQARLAERQVEEQLRYTRLLVANEIRSAEDAQADARARLATQRYVTQAAERSYALTQGRFRQGLAKLTDVADAELALRQAETNRLQAVYDYLVAQVDYEKATGRE